MAGRGREPRLRSAASARPTGRSDRTHIGLADRPRFCSKARACRISYESVSDYWASIRSRRGRRHGPARGPRRAGCTIGPLQNARGGASEPVLLPLAVEGARVDPEDPRGLLAARGGGQDPADVLGLEPLRGVTGPPTSTALAGLGGAAGRSARAGRPGRSRALRRGSPPARWRCAARGGCRARRGGPGPSRASAREAGQAAAGLAGEEGEQVVGQVERRRSRSRSGGQGQLDDVEPVEQVLAERARGDRRLQVAVGRGDEPDVGRRGSWSRRPARTSAPGGTGGAWAGAAAGRSPTSSRKSVPPSAAATLPAASRTAPVNAPRTWPNRSLSSRSGLRLGQLTVTNGPSARLLQAWRARARTPLPVPFSPRIRTAASVGATRRASSRTRPTSGSRPSQVGLGDLAPDPVLQVGHPVAEPADLRHPLQHGADLGGGERLGQVVERPPPHRLDGRVDARVGRDDDDRQPGRLRQQRLEQVEARLARRAGGRPGPRRTAAARPCRSASAPGRRLLDGVAHRLQGDAERPPDVRLVVDDQDPHGRARDRGSSRRQLVLSVSMVLAATTFSNQGGRRRAEQLTAPAAQTSRRTPR